MACRADLFPRLRLNLMPLLLSTILLVVWSVGAGGSAPDFITEPVERSPEMPFAALTARRSIDVLIASSDPADVQEAAAYTGSLRLHHPERLIGGDTTAPLPAHRRGPGRRQGRGGRSSLATS
jgi:hypothetical protein